MQTHRYFWDRNQRRIRSTNWSHLYPWFVPHSSLSTSSSLKSKKCPSEKYEKSTRSVQYIWPYCPLILEACAADFYETRPTTSTHRRNHVCQILLVDRFRGYRVLTLRNCDFRLTWCVALTTVWYCRDRETLWNIFFCIFHFNKYRAKSKYMGVALLWQYLLRWKSEEMWSLGCHLGTHMDCSLVI